MIENLLASDAERIKAFWLSVVILVGGIIWWIVDYSKRRKRRDLTWTKKK